MSSWIHKEPYCDLIILDQETKERQYMQHFVHISDLDQNYNIQIHGITINIPGMEMLIKGFSKC